jgi:glycosyltransferase involved in cell wall biosynthesis
LTLISETCAGEFVRIGLIAPPWLPVPPAAYGGIEAAVDVLACALQAAGHEVLMAASGDSTCPVHLLPGFPPSSSETVGDSLEELRHVALAYTALKDVDVIHDHTLFGPLYRNRGGESRIVTTVHGPFVPAMLDVYRAMPHDVSIIAISHHQASTGDGVNIARVIHHGIRLSDVPVGDGLGQYACFLGRMHPHKGLVEAIGIARKAGIPLRIAAKMNERREFAYFDACIRPLLRSDIEYLGEVGTADKYTLLGGATALISPLQWSEPFGMVMIESLATGTPVITTPRGAAPEIVDDGRTGFLRNDEREMVECISRVEELDRGLCRNIVEERFSAERMAADHLKLYRDTLTG